MASLQLRSFTPATQSHQEIALDVEISNFHLMCFGNTFPTPRSGEEYMFTHALLPCAYRGKYLLSLN